MTQEFEGGIVISSVIDITGYKYGRLTVLKEADPIKDKKGYNIRRWLCQCECGNQVIVRQACLRSGNTISCGCYKKDNAQKLYSFHLEGQVFGRLTVISEAEPGVNPNGTTYRRWLCQCDCGNQKIIRQVKLTSGETQSCGCLHKEVMQMNKTDLTGQTFGRWTVIKESDPATFADGSYNRKWLCKCQCGTEKEVFHSSLTKGLSLSCGCLKAENTSMLFKQYNQYDLSGKYGRGFTNKNEEFIFDLDDYDLIKDYCWAIDAYGYVSTKNQEHNLFFHQLVMNTSFSYDSIIDHINHVRSDNRKCNLRIVSAFENTWNAKISKNNTSGCTGVQIINLAHGRKKYSAMIYVHHQRHYLGRYDTYDEAVRARRDAENFYFGQYSYENSMKLAKQNSI